MSTFWGDGGSYSAWCDYLDRWVASPVALDERPPALDKDDFDSQTWTRLTIRLQNALGTKLDRWSSAVQCHAEVRDEFSLGRALVQSRNGLRTILALGSLPELPDVLRDQLRKQIVGIVTSIQQQLEDETQRQLRASPSTRHLAEFTLRQIRANPFTAVINEPAEVMASGAPSGGPDVPAVSRGRQILIDRQENL